MRDEVVIILRNLLRFFFVIFLKKHALQNFSDTRRPFENPCHGTKYRKPRQHENITILKYFLVFLFVHFDGIWLKKIFEDLQRSFEDFQPG